MIGRRAVVSIRDMVDWELGRNIGWKTRGGIGGFFRDWENVEVEMFEEDSDF